MGHDCCARYAQRRRKEGRNHGFFLCRRSVRRIHSGIWPAMTDYDDGGEFTYGEMAERIARIHVLFKAIGLKKGDKVALCGRNSSHWAIAMLATVSYEAVAVSIMDAFTPESIYALVKHSDARIFMVGDVVWKNLKVQRLTEA